MFHIFRNPKYFPRGRTQQIKKQILIYKALNWKIPEFVHLPMILGPNKERLSKRYGATGVQEYQKEGYQYEGLLNYLAFLGWNPGTHQEIFSMAAEEARRPPPEFIYRKYGVRFNSPI